MGDIVVARPLRRNWSDRFDPLLGVWPFKPHLCGYGSIIRYRSSLGVKFRSVPCLNSPLQGEFVPWRLWPPWKCFCRRCVRHCGDLMNIHLHNLISSYLQYILPFAHGLAFVWCFHTTRVLAPFGVSTMAHVDGSNIIPWDEHFRCSPGYRAPWFLTLTALFWPRCAFAFAWLRAHPQNGHDDWLSVVMSDD